MGDTLGHYAAYKGHFKVLQYLIKLNDTFNTPNYVQTQIKTERTDCNRCSPTISTIMDVQKPSNSKLRNSMNGTNYNIVYCVVFAELDAVIILILDFVLIGF